MTKRAAMPVWARVVPDPLKSQTKHNEEMKMPAPKTFGSFDAEFTAMCASAAAHGETNDCAVRAVTAATGETYEKVHAIMAQLGRKTRRGTSMEIIQTAVRLLGYAMISVTSHDFLSKYPSPHCNVLRNVTTHHPERFNRVWADGQTYLLRTARHILCVKNGRNVDWTKGSAKRVLCLYRVTKLA